METLKNGMEDFNAMKSIKLNLIQSTNFNKPYAFVDLMSWQIISKYRRNRHEELFH